MPDSGLPDGIIEATDSEPKNVLDVLVRLKAIQETLDKVPREALAEPVDLNAALAYLAKGQDGVACFNYLYMVITAEIYNKINQGNFFQDNEFLIQFDVAFAKRYLAAIRKYADPATRQSTPACWQALFENRQ